MIDDLERTSLLIAASIHDLDHMGRTSSFLVNAEHPLALLYNDMSVAHVSSHHFSAERHFSSCSATFGIVIM